MTNEIMKRIFGIIASGVCALGLSSCVEQSFVQYIPENAVAPVLNELDGGTYTLEEGGAFDTFTFSAASFVPDTDLPVSNSVQMAAAGTDFEKPRNVVSMTTEFIDRDSPSIAADAATVNSVLMRMGCQAGEETEVEFRLRATWTDYELISNTITAKVVPYYAEVEWPYYFMVGSISNPSWNFGEGVAQRLYDFAEEDMVYQGLVTFLSGAVEFKISAVIDWGGDEWGSSAEMTGDQIALVSKGGNIKMNSDKTYYHFTMDKASLTLKKDFSFNTMTVSVGGSESEMSFDKAKQRFYFDAALTTSSEISFKTDDGTTYGSPAAGATVTTAASATVVSGGTNAITSGEAGNFRIYLDMNNASAVTVILNAGDYGAEEEPEPDPVWIVHGQISGLEWQDHPMTAIKDGEAYKLEAPGVAAGSQFGFKDPNGQWFAVASTSSATITADQAFDITSEGPTNATISTAGDYDIYVIPESNKAYVMTKGSVPAELQ